MFNLLKQKNPHEFSARAVYAQILEQVRQPVFYTQYGVPDTFDGRFELLVVHLFMIMHALGEAGEGPAGFNQALFDAAFADMDQTLRNAGIGDMGVPKRMRRMMKGFNGRVHAYEDAMSDGDDQALEAALARNLYGTVEAPEAGYLEKMRGYMHQQCEALKAQSVEQILSGELIFQA